MAEDASRQLEEILANIQSSSDRSLAYGSLLQFQEISVNDPFAIQALSERSQRLLPLICADASYDDEEMSVSSSHSSPSKSLYYHYSSFLLKIFYRLNIMIFQYPVGILKVLILNSSFGVSVSIVVGIGCVGSYTPFSYYLSQNQLVIGIGTIIVLR